ncbi:hypothetical protein [Streptomyces sp. NPDC048202]|uniref:hypothetical protein n=1 Tax=Streptomyces sp. NPDC048202 TaxID=3365514 RepID=UPI0037197E8B
MTPSTALLHRIEQSPALATALICPADFDITRRDPIDELHLPGEVPLHPIADAHRHPYDLYFDPAHQ